MHMRGGPRRLQRLGRYAIFRHRSGRFLGGGRVCLRLRGSLDRGRFGRRGSLDRGRFYNLVWQRFRGGLASGAFGQGLVHFGFVQVAQPLQQAGIGRGIQRQHGAQRGIVLRDALQGAQRGVRVSGLALHVFKVWHPGSSQRIYKRQLCAYFSQPAPLSHIFPSLCPGQTPGRGRWFGLRGGLGVGEGRLFPGVFTL